jgi:hypothetical protein
MLLVEQRIIMEGLDRAITQLNHALYILPDLPPDSDVRGSLEATKATLVQTRTFAEAVHQKDVEVWRG